MWESASTANEKGLMSSSPVRFHFKDLRRATHLANDVHCKRATLDANFALRAF
jgi:hypothetical protein